MSEQVTRSIIVGCDASTCFRLWADFESFPRFMKHIRSVTRSGDNRSHWVMRGPLGADLEWDAQLTTCEPDKRIAWNSTPESRMRTSGQVTFTPLPNGQTQITVMLHYVPPGGAAGRALNELLADPGGNLQQDLRRFKAYAESLTAAPAGSAG